MGFWCVAAQYEAIVVVLRTQVLWLHLWNPTLNPPNPDPINLTPPQTLKTMVCESFGLPGTALQVPCLLFSGTLGLGFRVYLRLPM